MKTPYETMFLLPATATDEQINSIVERLEKAVEKQSGEFVRADKMGVRKTAYAVQKKNSAYYVMIQYRGIGATLDEVEKVLKNSDEVLKFLSTKITSVAQAVAFEPGRQSTPPAAESAPAEEPAEPAPAEAVAETPADQAPAQPESPSEV